MTRLASAFLSRPALVCFITAGDGDTEANLQALVDGGADIIELGMPFTDPMADGPAIQEANIRSLKAGTTTLDVLKIASEFRLRNPAIPLVLMGYANPMIRRGAGWFAEKASKAGVDGVICVDLPPEEDHELGPALRSQQIAPIRLATPTTDEKRLPAVLHKSDGFLYYVSVAGVTGNQQASIASIRSNVNRIKESTSLPVAVGFGVRTPEQAGDIAKVADGVVVGSALVEIIAKFGKDAPSILNEKTSAIANAVHSAG